MKKFILELFVLLSPYLYALTQTWKELCLKIKNFPYLLYSFLKEKIIYTTKKVKEAFLYSINKIWNLFKWISWPFRKMLWMYPITAFIACMYISKKYPDWYWSAYIWVGFFIVFMLTVAVFAIKDEKK